MRQVSQVRPIPTPVQVRQQRARLAAEIEQAQIMVFGLDEIGQDVVPAPPRIAKCFPIIKVAWLPADVHHNLVSRGSAYNYGANGFYSDQALSGVALRHNVLAAVGGTAVYLASDWGAFTTGEIVRVDGGYHVLGMPQAENL